MTMLKRRTLLRAGAVLAAAPNVPAWAQGKPKLRLNSVYGEKDIRAEAFRGLAKDVEADFEVEPHYNSTLFKQGTELVALQRNNLELANISAADVTKQVPEWSILTSAYLFRDANHMLNVFKSDVGRHYVKMAEEKTGIKLLGPIYYGTRQVGLKPKKKITTPADMAGIKLRMPPGDAWQLLGRALGANPTPMAFGEVYTGLQTGAIDGQDNPLPGVNAAKFYEVMSQIVLTSHWVAFDLLAASQKAWSDMGAEKQKRFQAAVDKALAISTQEHLKQEESLADDFRKAGLDIYTPDIAAFRTHAQKLYLESAEGKTWPAGMLDRIAAVE